jgi:hypothetical protein
LLVVGCWLLVVGCWLLVVGCWLLVVGCWLLVVGCWFLSGLATSYPCTFSSPTLLPLLFFLFIHHCYFIFLAILPILSHFLETTIFYKNLYTF